MAMLVHLLMIFTGLVGPLILWLVKKDESAFINHHGKESVNFVITNIIAYVIIMAITAVTFGLGAFLFIPLGIVVLIFAILACVAANKGEWYRIPMNIRFIR